MIFVSNMYNIIVRPTQLIDKKKKSDTAATHLAQKNNLQNIVDKNWIGEKKILKFSQQRKQWTMPQ